MVSTQMLYDCIPGRHDTIMQIMSKLTSSNERCNMLRKYPLKKSSCPEYIVSVELAIKRILNGTCVKD